MITDRALSYNGAKTATRKHFFQKQLNKWMAKRKKEKQNLQTYRRRREGKIWTFEIINYAKYHFILWKIIKNKSEHL